jgi:BlaI family transcriptional regulator, penicillinase repressor
MRISTHMRKNTHTSEDPEFSRRERQIMDVLYSCGEATAREIWQRMSQAPTYSTVRTLLAVLEDKGHVVRRLEGKAFVYRPKRQRESAAGAALRRLLTTFFQGSVEQAVSGLLEMEDKSLSNAELARIAKMISQARKEKK